MPQKLLQPPPLRTPFFDANGEIAETWRRFFLSTQSVITLLLTSPTGGGGSAPNPMMLFDDSSGDESWFLPLTPVPFPTHKLLDGFYDSDTVTGSASQGSLIAGDALGRWSGMLTPGTPNWVLIGTGVDTVWSQRVPFLDLANTFTMFNAFTTTLAGTQQLTVQNLSADPAAITVLKCINDLGNGCLTRQYSSTVGGTGINRSDGGALLGNGTGGMSVAAIQDLRFYAGGVAAANLRATIFLSGGVSIGDTTDPGATNLRVAGTLTHVKAEVDLSYVVSAPITGGTVTMAAGQQRAIINPAGTIAALTVTLPSSPTDGQIAGMSFTQIVTALVINAPGGATVVAPPASAAVDSAFRFLYQASSTSWFPAP